ncbi:MAG: tetratricopeptide repeat protein [Clostridia bacterium]
MKNVKFAYLFIISGFLIAVGFVFFSFFGKEIMANKLISYALEQDSKSAIIYYNTALKLSPENATARNNLVEIYYENQNYEEALASIEQGILENPDNDNLYFYKVKINEYYLQIEQAINIIENVDSAYVKSKFSNRSDIQPVFNCDSGTYNQNVEIVIEKSENTNIYYKINAEKYHIYENSFELTDGFYDIKAVAIDQNGLVSNVSSIEIFVENLVAPVSFATSTTIDSILEQMSDFEEINRDALLSMTEIDLSNSVLFDEDIETLLNCRNLTSLKLGDISNVTTFYPLTKLSELTEISIMKGCTSNLMSELISIENLKILQIYDSKINILPENKTLLTSLTLKNCLIYNISNISSYKTLESLDLSQNLIDELYGIEELKKIKALNLSNNKISDITLILGIMSIKSLDVSYNQISSIKNISSLNFLEQVNISNNEIATVLEFANLRYLTTLNCSFNNILTLEPLVSSKSLTEIYANDNNINDISYIDNIENLTYINVANNNLS